MANLREASEQAKAAIADLRGDKGPLKGITGDLQQTLASARDAMADLAENTEALKRSFFFRGFFNKRGYFDLHDVSVAAISAGGAGDQAIAACCASGCVRRSCSSGREAARSD